jgi:outer membrane protein TolC
MKNKFMLFLLLLVATTFAQEKKGSYSFSLKEAISHALQNNYSAINANRDIEAAKKKKWETTTMGLPQINGSLGYQNNIEIQKSLIPAEIFGGSPGTFQEVAFGVKHNMNANLTLSQLIFDGSYLVGLQSAKTYLQISENAKIKTNQEITEMVVNSYGNVLLADESILILGKNKQNLEKTLFQTNEIFKNGLIEEENVEQLQITLTSLDNSLKNVNRQRTIAAGMLKLLLGIDLNDELILTEKLENVSQNNIDLALLNEQFDVNNSIDYKIGKNLETSKELLLKLEKSKALPSIGAALNFGYNSFGSQFNFLSSNQKWFNFSNVGVQMSIPIFSSFGRRSRTQQAQIALDQSKTELTQTQQKLHLQFDKAKSDYEFTLEQLTNAKSNLKLAERIENKNQIKFKEGLATSFELTEAQRQLYATQQNYLQAMLDVINKKATLEKLLNKN